MRTSSTTPLAVATAAVCLLAATNGSSAQQPPQRHGEPSAGDVETAAQEEGPGARFYADLYVGLYYELTGEIEKAGAAIKRAASLPNRGYMVEVARVHRRLRYP